jgi:hypothetical protein
MFEWTADDMGGVDLFYNSPKATSKGKTLSYGAFITSPEPWTGTLNLLFDVSPGNGMEFRFPTIVSGSG